MGVFAFASDVRLERQGMSSEGRSTTREAAGRISCSPTGLGSGAVVPTALRWRLSATTVVGLDRSRPWEDPVNRAGAVRSAFRSAGLSHPGRSLRRVMALPVPNSLTPSKVSTFKDCALAFRFSVIDRLPEPPSPHALKGTLVHRALQGLFWEHSRGRRSPEAARVALRGAWESLQEDDEFRSLDLSDDAAAAFLADAEKLVDGYFRLEDPDAVDAVGVEVGLEAEVGGLLLRGIIDRLDVTPDGDFVVVDYKTGRVPAEAQEHSRLGGVQFYALLCEQVLGRRPVSVRLLYLREPVAIVADPSEQALRGLRQRTGAVWSAIERACAEEDFRPKPSRLCDWCAFQALCPAFGGDPSLAAGLGRRPRPADSEERIPA